MGIPEERIPECMHFGGAIHDGLAALLQKKDMREAFERALRKDMDKVIWRTNFEEALKDGFTLLYHHFKEGYHIQPLEVEKRYTVHLEHPVTKEKLPLPIMSVMDVIDKREMIIDHKVVSSPIAQKQADVDIQATAYWMVYEVVFGKSPRSFWFNQLVRRKYTPRIEPPLHTTRNAIDKILFWEYAKDILNRIENEQFDRNIGTRCSNCSYKSICL